MFNVQAHFQILSEPNNSFFCTKFKEKELWSARKKSGDISPSSKHNKAKRETSCPFETIRWYDTSEIRDKSVRILSYFRIWPQCDLFTKHHISKSKYQNYALLVFPAFSLACQIWMARLAFYQPRLFNENPEKVYPRKFNGPKSWTKWGKNLRQCWFPS